MFTIYKYRLNIIDMRIKFRVLSMALAVCFCMNGMAQQTDPTLTGAVAAQTEMLKKLFKKRGRRSSRL